MSSLANPTFAGWVGRGSVGAEMPVRRQLPARRLAAPARRRLAAPAAAAAALLAVATLALAACGNDSSTNNSAGRAGRPSTTATLRILQPTPNETTAPSVAVQLQLTGGTVAPVGSTLALVANQGHIHLYLDNLLISMTQSLNQSLPTLTAGLHTVRAEFVANDHQPWNPRVTAEVAFTVQ